MQCTGLFSSDDRKADPFLLVRIVLKFPFNTSPVVPTGTERVGSGMSIVVLTLVSYHIYGYTDFGGPVAAVCMSLAQRIDIFLL